MGQRSAGCWFCFSYLNDFFVLFGWSHCWCYHWCESVIGRTWHHDTVLAHLPLGNRVVVLLYVCDSDGKWNNKKTNLYFLKRQTESLCAILYVLGRLGVQKAKQKPTTKCWLAAFLCSASLKQTLFVTLSVLLRSCRPQWGLQNKAIIATTALPGTTRCDLTEGWNRSNGPFNTHTA